jgi:NAD+ diphosphatase
MSNASGIVMHHIAAQTGINRMGEKRRERDWLDAQRASPEARFTLMVDLKFAILSNEDRSGTRLRLFTKDALTEAGLDPGEASFLGIEDGRTPLFSLAISPAEAAHLPGGPESFAPLVDLRTLAAGTDLPAGEVSLAAQARALACWHAAHRCCGRCGGRTRPREGGWRRDCWACGQLHFPRSDPAVIMLITYEDRCLLGHEPRFQDHMYSVLAGFVEPGDDIETAVRREIMEEAGVPVGRVDYVTSQPWPFPHSLMIGCRGEALSDRLTLDPVELPEAQWFSREDVRLMLEKRHPLGHFVPPPLSISHTLIRAFAEGTL